MLSNRTLNNILNILPAIAVLRHVRNPNTPLAVIPDDFKDLRLFFMMRGPLIQDIPSEEAIRDKGDKEVLQRLKVEDESFEDVCRAILPGATNVLSSRVPTNFAGLKSSVDIWKVKVKSRLTPSEVVQGITLVEGLLRPIKN